MQPTRYMKQFTRSLLSLLSVWQQKVLGCTWQTTIYIWQASIGFLGYTLYIPPISKGDVQHAHFFQHCSACLSLEVKRYSTLGSEECFDSDTSSRLPFQLVTGDWYNSIDLQAQQIERMIIHELFWLGKKLPTLKLKVYF